MTSSTDTNSIITGDFSSVLSQPPLTTYRGRFAPSPSGKLHFGSLIAALGSFLQARSAKGQWFVRMEDIDPPREMVGADKEILNALEVLGLHWDGEVRFQSKQNDLYDAVLNELHQQGLSYYCQCTRKQIRAYGGIYNGHCRNLNNPAGNTSTRLVNQFPNTHFDDILLGRVSVDSAMAAEDFVIHRRDGLYAYQLAVVLDDIDQGITEIVRGADLLEPTARQISFYQTLNAHIPKFLHLPLAVTKQGLKLSKQNKSPAIDLTQPQLALVDALSFLGQKPPRELKTASVDEVIQWAISHWQLSLVPTSSQICSPEHS